MAKLGKRKNLRKRRKSLITTMLLRLRQEIAVKEAKLLKEIVDEFESVEQVEKRLGRAHALEREADEVCHSIFESLITDFVTPIDREDVIGIAENLDEVIDLTEEIIQRFYMYDIHFMHDDAKKFVKLIVRSCEALSNAMADFRNCKKSNTFKSLIYQVNQLEDEADELYIKLIRQLYTKRT